MSGLCVILANGDFPRKGGTPWGILATAKRVVACDGAAKTYRRRFGRWPDVVIGDLDSFRPGRSNIGSSLIVACDDQETNDLEKAIHYCRSQGWRNLVIVGATGRREDHTLGNVFRALDAKVPLISDFGAFHPVCGRRIFRCRKGTGISVFAPDPKTHMTSKGLEWPLDGVRFRNLHVATLNRTSGNVFSVVSDRPVFVFVEKVDGFIG